MKIGKAPADWKCTLGDHPPLSLPDALYRVERNDICQTCFEEIKAYEPPKPRYALNFHDWAHDPRSVTIFDSRQYMDIGWFTRRQAEAVCKLLNEMDESDE